MTLPGNTAVTFTVVCWGFFNLYPYLTFFESGISAASERKLILAFPPLSSGFIFIMSATEDIWHFTDTSR